MRPNVGSILAASDLGPASDPVVAAAAAFAERLGAELHLINALDIGRLPALEAPTYPGRFRQAETLLEEQARRVAPGVRPASLRVVDQPPHRAIEDRAAEVSAGLVALGPHAGGEVGARFLGTTADRVIRTAEVPSLVVRAPLRLPLRGIGVPTDFSAPSRGALEAALALAPALGGSGAALHLFHAGWFVEREDDPGLEDRELGPALEREAAEAASRVGSPPVRVHTEVVWEASPTEAIIRYASTRELDLLVMGTHGEGGLRRFLVGSVASGVARQAPCSVLLVPPSFAA